MEKVFAQRSFVIEASRDRVWDLIGRVTIDSLQPEGFNYEDESNFSATIKAKAAFITLPMQLKGQIASIVPPETLVTVLNVTGLSGMLKVGQKVSYKLNAVDGKTEIACVASGEMPGFIGLLLTPVAKNFANKIFADVEKMLRNLA
ncbi:MAG: hypothetical protein PHR56_02470 [Dehalococcoidales bacterium]|nr:hypothetical protein [Dehalococcoidales bacterium]